MSHPPPSNGPGAHGERWCFIYYRVHLDDLPHAVAATREGQHLLCDAHPGLSASLMQRPSTSSPPGSPPTMTLLETYRIPLDWHAERVQALHAQIEQILGATLAPWLQGPRHLELFEPCA